MIRNYFITAFRRLSKRGVFTFINIFGLTVGITAFIMMALYIDSELSYDTFHANADRIVRVTTFKQTPEASFNRAQCSMPVGPALQADFPEVEQAARIIKTEALVQYNQVQNRETELAFADNNLFEVFQFELLRGSLVNALQAPFTMVITEKTATRYFSNEDPIGKTLTLDDDQKYHVTAVVKSLPSNSHFSFDGFLSMQTAAREGSGYDWLFTNWYSQACYTYLLLDRSQSISKIERELPAFEQRHKQADEPATFKYSLERLPDIYLHSKLDNQIGKTGSMTNVLVFSAVAVFILFIAAVNYINLATAHAADRSREVGLRKVAGASKAQLRWQYLSETLIITSASTLLALGICQLILPLFNHLSGKQLEFHIGNYALAYVALFVLLVSIVAGYYPAFVISNFKPVEALRGKFGASPFGSIRLREVLVILQFSMSALLIVCCLVVYSQLRYINKLDVGFDREQTMIINTYGDRYVQTHLQTFKQELESIKGVEMVSASSRIPGDGKSGWSMEFNVNGQILKTELPVFIVDHDFLKLYKIPLVAGRDLDENIAADSVESMIINESAIRELGFTQNEKALGVTVDMYPSRAKIIGVFRDFNYESLHTPIGPLAMRMVSGQLQKLSIRIKSSDIPATVSGVEAKWKTLLPNKPLEYTFLDDDFNNKYQAENKFGQVFIVFALLAITISCVGLYGLSLISAQQRRKEIGIRKVVGASVTTLVVILTKDYLKLVVISLVIAFPLAYYLMSRWLTMFSYRTEVTVTEFLLTAIISVFVALATVIIQTLKTSSANPIDALKQD